MGQAVTNLLAFGVAPHRWRRSRAKLLRRVSLSYPSVVVWNLIALPASHPR